MKSSMTQAIHTGMIMGHLPVGRQVRDSPEKRSGLAIWQLKSKL